MSSLFLTTSPARLISRQRRSNAPAAKRYNATTVALKKARIRRQYGKAQRKVLRASLRPHNGPLLRCGLSQITPYTLRWREMFRPNDPQNAIYEVRDETAMSSQHIREENVESSATTTDWTALSQMTRVLN